MPKSKNATFATCTFRGVTLILASTSKERPLGKSSSTFELVPNTNLFDKNIHQNDGRMK